MLTYTAVTNHCENVDSMWMRMMRTLTLLEISPKQSKVAKSTQTCGQEEWVLSKTQFKQIVSKL